MSFFSIIHDSVTFFHVKNRFFYFFAPLFTDISWILQKYAIFPSKQKMYGRKKKKENRLMQQIAEQTVSANPPESRNVPML